MVDGSTGVSPGGQRRGSPAIIRVALYLQMLASVVAVAAFICTPAACALLYDSEYRVRDVANLFMGFVPPVVAALCPAVIVVASFIKKVGWLGGTGFTALSLVLSYVLMGVWVQVWS